MSKGTSTSGEGEKMTKDNNKDQVLYLTEKEFWSEIKDEYIQRIAEMDPNDVYPSNNPGMLLFQTTISTSSSQLAYLGPTKPDGSLNYGREAITCQKASTEEELEAGACGDQLLAFMECAMRTQCFKMAPKDDESSSS
ncbi:hypothetical protein OESDEN_20356 [Oesophagostomum dentatum]|uniref:CHCH domain protein n=1 Tax=Oesophagostomum dentatum TaxID=61180 RepID=A0A0B1S3N9_OESDE|nr:hypothetical protein OESDEN_20356 [Oesophagostomum dentatum]